MVKIHDLDDKKAQKQVQKRFIFAKKRPKYQIFDVILHIGTPIKLATRFFPSIWRNSHFYGCPLHLLKEIFMCFLEKTHFPQK